MQQELLKYYDAWNKVFIKLNNRDLPRNVNYWPSSAYNQKDLDVLQTAYVQSNTPSAAQERANRRTPIPKDAFSKFQQHIKEAEWFVNMALPIYETNKILSDPSVENLIKQGMGDLFYKNLNQSLSNIGLTPPQKIVPSSKLEGFFDRRLNDWVAAKIGGTLSVPLKQLLSVVNYAENMPIGQWAVGFTKAVAPWNIAKTWKQMMDDVPYLKTRLGSGYSEAMHRALQGDEEIARSKTANIHQAFKNVMTIGTRYGDIAAIILGGKPYLDYLLKKEGLSEKEAVDKFLEDTLRSQQSPYSSTLSKFQNSKNFAYRALFAFANTPSQYMRKLFEANQNFKKVKAKFKKGEITKNELKRLLTEKLNVPACGVRK